MLQLEHAEQIRADLDQHALLESGRLNGSHISGVQNPRIVARKPSQVQSRCYDPRCRGIRCGICEHGRIGSDRSLAGAADPRAWTPPIDVYETADRYVVTAEVPGLTRDRSSSRSRTRASRSGAAARAHRRAKPVVHYHQVERGHGPFARTFEFADQIDADAVIADLPNGVLTVTLPKLPSAAGRGKIEVRVDAIATRLHRLAAVLASSMPWLRGRPGADRAAAHGRRNRRRRPGDARRRAAAGARPRRSPARRRTARSHRRGRTRRRQRDQHLVHPDRPRIGLAVRERPVLPLLLRRRGRRVRQSRAPGAEPRLRRDRVVGRLPPHQQPRRRRRGARVSVVLPDKRELPAKVVGVDETTDIAVLKIDARNLPVLPWGDSSKLKVAEWVLAIGNPFQLNQTVTLGIVSARPAAASKGGSRTTRTSSRPTPRSIPATRAARWSTRAASWSASTPPSSARPAATQGIGFAVPSNLAQHVMDDLIKFGEVQRGTIPGIKVQPMTPQMAQQLGAPNTRGALVVAVDQRSDAYRRRSPCPATSSSASTAPSTTPSSSSGCCPTRNRHDRDPGPAPADRAGDREAGGHASQRRASDRGDADRPRRRPGGCRPVAAGRQRDRTDGPRRRPDTATLPLAVHRHSGSTPTVIPMRRLHSTARGARPRSSMRSAPAVRSLRLCRRPIPSARVRLPGPRQSAIVSSAAAGRPVPRARRRRINSSPSRGSSARISTAAGAALGLGDGVHEVVDAVIQVDVGDTRTAVERRIARGRPGRRVAGRIRFADVGLDLDDHARGDAGGRLVHQDLADQVARDLERGTGVERPRQDRSGRHPGRRRITDAS